MKQDYDDLSLSKIAKQLGLTRPALYSYFNSKEELFLEISKIEYIAMGQKLNNTFKIRMNNREFCHTLVQTLASDHLFIKLLALHQQVMEQKVSYAAMKNFKEGTMPFLKNLHSIVERQIPPY